jgi:hypothetical protein
MKVAFLRLLELLGFPPGYYAVGRQVYVQILPQKQGSFGDLSGTTTLSCESWWTFCYTDSNSSSLCLMLRDTVPMLQEQGRLTLPLKWFPANTIVTQEFPFRMLNPIFANSPASAMIQVHLSENGDQPFRAPDGNLLVKLQPIKRQPPPQYPYTPPQMGYSAYAPAGYPPPYVFAGYPGQGIRYPPTPNGYPGQVPFVRPPPAPGPAARPQAPAGPPSPSPAVASPNPNATGGESPNPIVAAGPSPVITGPSPVVTGPSPVVTGLSPVAAGPSPVVTGAPNPVAAEPEPKRTEGGEEEEDTPDADMELDDLDVPVLVPSGR